jgi:hypothetical protein
MTDIGKQMDIDREKPQAKVRFAALPQVTAAR